MSENINIVHIGQKANIRNIKDVHADLYSKFNDSGDIVLDISECQEVDLSLIQLIESARLYASKTGKPIRLSAPANEQITSVLTRAGFLENAKEDDRRFWFSEGVQ